MLLPLRRPVPKQQDVQARPHAKGYSAIVLLLVAGLWPIRSFAQTGGPRPSDASALVDITPGSVDRFQDVSVAHAEGYVLRFACVTGPEARTTGLYFVNQSLIADGEIDAAYPEVIIYAPLTDGRLQLVGADYLVPYEQWHAKHIAPPELFGQRFRVVDTPNPFRLGMFDTLHLAVWNNKPSATFLEWWDANVTCGTIGK